jgi:2-polyprenyl-6-methoxyphenol hydroxylase-like FAD-dependent oxidoreductase
VSATRPLHILIAGGGLSGLALAQGLVKEGHTCEVFERDTDDSRQIGYYLTMNADGGEALRRCLPEDLFDHPGRPAQRAELAAAPGSGEPRRARGHRYPPPDAPHDPASPDG